MYIRIAFVIPTRASCLIMVRLEILFKVCWGMKKHQPLKFTLNCAANVVVNFTAGSFK